MEEEGTATDSAKCVVESRNLNVIMLWVHRTQTLVRNAINGPVSTRFD